MNHCGQSPRFSYCWAKTTAQDRLGRRVVLEREQQLERALADVARAPGRDRILLEAVRRREMDHRVMREPGENRVERLGFGAGVLQPNAARDPPPDARGLAASSALPSTPLAYLAASASAARFVGQRADDGEGEIARRRGCGSRHSRRRAARRRR